MSQKSLILLLFLFGSAIIAHADLEQVESSQLGTHPDDRHLQASDGLKTEIATSMTFVPGCAGLPVSALLPAMEYIKHAFLPPLCAKYFDCIFKNVTTAFTERPDNIPHESIANSCIASYPEQCILNDDGTGCEFSSMAAGSYLDVYPGGDTGCAFGQKNYHFRVRKGDPKKVAVYFEGGGSCWDPQTCVPVMNMMTYLYKADMFQSHQVAPLWYRESLKNVDDPTNPYRDWTMVGVTYCTGDIHTGTKVVDMGFDMNHIGMLNTEAVLAWTHRNIPAASIDEVTVMGCSAGALGAQMWSDRLMGTDFAVVPKRVVLIDSFLGRSAPSFWLETYPNWGITLLGDVGFPGGPQLPGFDWSQFVNFVIRKNPDVLFAIIQSALDGTQRKYYTMNMFGKYELGNEESWLSYEESVLSGYMCMPNARFYISNSDKHCFIFEDYKREDDPKMFEWIETVTSADSAQVTNFVPVSWRRFDKGCSEEYPYGYRAVVYDPECPTNAAQGGVYDPARGKNLCWEGVRPCSDLEMRLATAGSYELITLGCRSCLLNDKAICSDAPTKAPTPAPLPPPCGLAELSSAAGGDVSGLSPPCLQCAIANQADPMVCLIAPGDIKESTGPAPPCDVGEYKALSEENYNLVGSRCQGCANRNKLDPSVCQEADGETKTTVGDTPAVTEAPRMSETTVLTSAPTEPMRPCGGHATTRLYPGEWAADPSVQSIGCRECVEANPANPKFCEDGQELTAAASSLAAPLAVLLSAAAAAALF